MPDSAFGSPNSELTKSITAHQASMEYVRQCMNMRASNARYSATACAGLTAHR
jgi:hypothetical protein